MVTSWFPEHERARIRDRVLHLRTVRRTGIPYAAADLDSGNAGWHWVFIDAGVGIIWSWSGLGLHQPPRLTKKP